jgi:nicotinamide-nucleotide amidase
MAENARRVLKSTWSIATSGIAGPDGGTPEKPVGTVWIAVSGPAGTVARKFLFGNDRQRNIQKSATAALELLREQLISLPDNHSDKIVN